MTKQNKNKVIPPIRISEQEYQILKAKIEKTDNNMSEYIRLLILGYKPENKIKSDSIIELSYLWEKLRQKNTDKEILEQLKTIIINLNTQE